ncbi:cytochrome P450 [Lentzea tibetensis]|nr:cytochrome P450 [Lentzea tibetensis]
MIFEWHERTAREGLRDPVRREHGAWFVHRYADARRVLTDHDTFSSDELRYNPQAPHAANPVLRSLIATDPPRHAALRAVVAQQFTKRVLDRTRERIGHDAAQLANELHEGADFIETFARPLPTRTICHLLGIEPDPRFARWTDAVTTFIGTRATHDTQRTFAEIADYFRTWRRTSDTPLARSDLTDQEVADFCTLLLTNGTETTTTLLASAVLVRDRFPGAPDDVEELLRLLPPAGGTDRFATRDTTIGRHRIRRGDRVVAMVVSANRDPDVFADPHVHRPGRNPNPHLGFGRGTHFCLGAHLTRAQVAVALAQLPRTWRPLDLKVDGTPVGPQIAALRVTSGS